MTALDYGWGGGVPSTKGQLGVLGGVGSGTAPFPGVLVAAEPHTVVKT